MVVLLSGCSTLVKSDSIIENSSLDNEAFCKDQEHQFIEAINWRESGMSKDIADKKMNDFFELKYGNHKVYSKASSAFQELVDYVYENDDLESKNVTVLSAAVYASCGGVVY